MRRTAALGLAAAGLAAAAGAELAVWFVAPPPGKSLLGEVEVVAAVEGGPAASVALYFDGAKVRTLAAPPWRFLLDVGDENRERTLRVVARTATGESAEATLRTPALQIDEVLELPLRQVYVTAEGPPERGRAAGTGLARTDFRLSDEGERQKLVTFERGDAPLTAVLLVDSSLSMEGEPWRAALVGVEAFAGRLAPLDEAMLLLFSDHVEHASPFTGAGPEIVAGAGAAVAGGGTAINDHLYLGLELLERRQGRRVAILLSDGIDIESVLSAHQVAELAARSQAMVYWVRVTREPFGTSYRSPWREPAEHAAEIAALDALVRASGGRRLDIGDVGGVTGALEEILAELRAQYVLGYYPSRARRDGAWHRIEVEVLRSGVRARARDGYFDD